MEEPLEQTISARQLGAAFSGCFLGAGYVSGREMWQFFGRFGPVGWLGLCLSIALLGGAGLLLLTMVRRTGRHELSFLMVPWQCPALRHLLALFSVLLLFGVVTIMTAGTGAALHQAFGLPPWLCGLLFALLIAALSLSGLRGMISIFSFAAPALVLCTVGLGAGALLLLPVRRLRSRAVLGGFPPLWHFRPITCSALWQSWPPWGGMSHQGALQGELAWAVPCFSWWPRRFCLS